MARMPAMMCGVDCNLALSAMKALGVRPIAEPGAAPLSTKNLSVNSWRRRSPARRKVVGPLPWALPVRTPERHHRHPAVSSLFFSCFFFSLSPMIRAFPPVASFRVSSPNTRKRDSSSRNDLPVMLQTPVFSLRMKSSA